MNPQTFSAGRESANAHTGAKRNGRSRLHILRFRVEGLGTFKDTNSPGQLLLMNFTVLSKYHSWTQSSFRVSRSVEHLRSHGVGFQGFEKVW